MQRPVGRHSVSDHSQTTGRGRYCASNVSSAGDGRRMFRPVPVADVDDIRVSSATAGVSSSAVRPQKRPLKSDKNDTWMTRAVGMRRKRRRLTNKTVNNNNINDDDDDDDDDDVISNCNKRSDCSSASSNRRGRKRLVISLKRSSSGSNNAVTNGQYCATVSADADAGVAMTTDSDAGETTDVARCQGDDVMTAAAVDAASDGCQSVSGVAAADILSYTSNNNGLLPSSSSSSASAATRQCMTLHSDAAVRRPTGDRHFTLGQYFIIVGTSMMCFIILHSRL